ncbi:MAG: Hpt domain-containing protein [Alphaproteobacteria bacterium]|nr:Hpt domain-containing protein [Alphaproteobacteria bacterium]
MSESVNLDNLRAMTGGDKAVEYELFTIFLESSEELLSQLQEALARGDQELWRRSAHAFKGTALNLGAPELAHLAATAQSAPQEEKQRIFGEIQKEYARVKGVIFPQSSARRV